MGTGAVWLRVVSCVEAVHCTPVCNLSISVGNIPLEKLIILHY